MKIQELEKEHDDAAKAAQSAWTVFCVADDRWNAETPKEDLDRVIEERNRLQAIWLAAEEAERRARYDLWRAARQQESEGR